MNSTARLAVGALVAVIAVGGALYLFGPNGSGPGGPAPTPTILPPTTAPSPSGAAASPGLDTSAWTTYTSNRYGFSIGHPADWTENPADHTWTLAADANFLTTGSEGFRAPGDTIRVTAWSVVVTPGTTADTWLQAYCPLATTPCTGLQSRTVAATMDGHAGSVVSFKDDVQAFILVNDRMYVVAVWREHGPTVAPYGGAVRLLQAYLSTMHLLPGGPAPSAPIPGPS